jgi:lipopolysaccharide transport system permease protein
LTEIVQSARAVAARGDARISADPIIRIRATKGWASLDPRTIWASRELLSFLIWRDLKVRYAQTLLGAAWAVLQPLSMMAVFTVIFWRFSTAQPDHVPYPLLAYAGLLPWTFFSNATGHSAHSLVGSAHILTKVYFPRVLIPIAAVLSSLVDLLLALLLVAPLMAYYHVRPTWMLLTLPPAIVLTTVVALAVGVWIAAVNVKYRDVRFALPFLMQLWLFGSPVFYSTSQLPGRWRWIMAVNPVVAPIEAFRAALLAVPIDAWMVGVSVSSTIVLIACAAWIFCRIERSFADIV